jgi:hypothetical protein
MDKSKVVAVLGHTHSESLGDEVNAASHDLETVARILETNYTRGEIIESLKVHNISKLKDLHKKSHILFRSIRPAFSSYYINFKKHVLPLETSDSISDIIDYHVGILDAAADSWYESVFTNLKETNLLRQVVTKLNEFLVADVENQPTNVRESLHVGNYVFGENTKLVCNRLEKDNYLTSADINMGKIIRNSLLRNILPLTEIAAVQMGFLLDVIADEDGGFLKDYCSFAVEEDVPVLTFDYPRFIEFVNNTHEPRGSSMSKLKFLLFKLNNGTTMKIYGCPFGGGFTMNAWQGIIDDFEKYTFKGES